MEQFNELWYKIATFPDYNAGRNGKPRGWNHTKVWVISDKEDLSGTVYYYTYYGGKPLPLLIEEFRLMLTNGK